MSADISLTVTHRTRQVHSRTKYEYDIRKPKQLTQVNAMCTMYQPVVEFSASAVRMVMKKVNRKQERILPPSRMGAPCSRKMELLRFAGQDDVGERREVGKRTGRRRWIKR